MLICAVGFALFFWGISALMKSSDAYKEALARAKAEPAVIEALGTPIREGFFLTGNVQLSGSRGDADLAIPISGPNGKATVYVVAKKSMGQWTFRHLIIEIQNTGKRIDISDKEAKPDDARDRAELRSIAEVEAGSPS